MWAIYKRELKSYLNSFIGLLFVAVTVFFVSLYFFVCNLYSGYPYFTYALSSVMILFLISVPVLTMKVFAEERKNKTDQMILTAPVSVGAVVMGKYLALVTIYAIPTLIFCTYPLIMCLYGTVPLPENYLGILGFFLYGSASIAVGVLISALTESQVIAAVLTFIVLFAGYMMSSLCSLISETGNWVTKILSLFNMETPYNNMLTGTLDVSSIVYFLCLIGLCLFLTAQSIQKRRYSVSTKTLSLSAYNTTGIALVVAIICVINLVIGELPMSIRKIDLTSNNLYSLTDTTIDYVKTIDKDVTIYVLAATDSRDETVAQTLERYEDLNDKIHVEYVDPNVNPKFYRQYTDSTSMGSLIVDSGERYMVIDYENLYETSYEMDYTTYSYNATTTGYDAEGQVTSALAYVLSEDLPKLYFTTGHGESTLSDTFTSAITKENVDTETINLMNVEEVPEDAAGLIIYAASSDFSADDKEKVLNYLEAGGKVLFIANVVEYSELPNLSEILAYMGMSIEDGLVVDEDMNYYYRSPYYLLPDIVSTELTSTVYNKYYIFAPYSKGITFVNTDDENLSVSTMLNSSSSSYSLNSTGNLQNYGRTGDEVDGPFSIAAYAERTISEDTTAYMVVFGCSQIFTDNANEMVSGANALLFTQTIGTFAEHELSVSVPVKSYDVSYLTVTQSSSMLCGAITIIILPLGCMIVGFVIWFRRRKR